MARTFISQPTQVFSSEQYDDTLAAGSTLQSTSTSIQSDLNAIRSQIRKILWAGVSGSWYDAVSAPSGSNSARGLNTLNSDLTDLEQKRFLFRSQNLNIVNVATGSNFALLSVSLGTAPSNFIATTHPSIPVGSAFATGSVVAMLGGSEGTYGSHSVTQTSGSSVLTPKNLIVVRDAWSGNVITGTLGRDIYGLLQVESGSVSGDAFNDSTRRTQISFVEELITNATSSLVATPVSRIGGRSIVYSYVKRTALDNIPEDAYLSNTIFTDQTETTTAGANSATLDQVIDNQVGTVTQDQSIAIRIAAGFSWSFLSGTKELWRLVSSDSEDTLTVAVDRIAFSSSQPSAFQAGISVATGSTMINIGLAAGTLATLLGQNLILSGGNQLRFSDNYGPVSTYTGGTIPFATSSTEWNNFVAGFGNATSILGAIGVVSQSLSSSLRRTRFTAGVTTNVSADANVTFPTNLDVALGSYVGRDFTKDLEIYYNGVMLLPGRSSGDPNDVYPGTSAAGGDLRFPYPIKSGTQISMVRY